MKVKLPCRVNTLLMLVVFFFFSFLSELFARPDFNINPKVIERGIGERARRIPLYINNNGDGEDLEWSLELVADVDGWITVGSTEGTIRNGGRDSTIVWLDGRNLEEEHVYAFLNFESNDPNRVHFTVPVAGHTEPYPRIEYYLPDAWSGGWRLYDMNRILDEEIFWGEEYSFQLTLYNPNWNWRYHDGGARVDVDNLPCNNGYFALNPTEFSIEHDANRQITVTFTAEQIGQNTAEIISISSAWDPEELIFRISAVVSPVFRLGSRLRDIEIDEDSEECIIADLDTIFISSYQGNVYEVPVAPGLVPRIARNGEFFLRPRSNFFGITEVVVTASVEDSTLADTFQVTVNPLPDPPGPFDLISPSDGDTIHPTEGDTLFIWQMSHDPDLDTLLYEVAIVPEELGIRVTWEDIPDTFLTTSVLGEVMDLDAGGRFTWTVKARDREYERNAWSTFTNYLAPASVGEDDCVPRSHGLISIYPNPFNNSLSINIHFEHSDQLRISVYDTRGRLVSVIEDVFVQPGDQSFSWTPATASSGRYMIRIDTGDRMEVRSVVLSR